MEEETDLTTKAEETAGDKEPATAGVGLEISAYRRVLKNRGFMALWVGQGMSGVGDWVIVGVLLDMVNRMGGFSGLAWMMTFRFLPAFLFGLVAGAVVDRLERKTTMIFCEIARAVLVVLLAFANSLTMICALVFGIECFTLVFGPSRDASIPDLVSKDEVMTANSMMSTSTYLTMALGTMIATVLLGFVALLHKVFPISRFIGQSQFAFIIDALTFIASAMLIFTVDFPKRFEERPKMSAGHVWNDLKEGVHFMRTNPLTRSILGVMIVGFIGGGSLYILGAPFAKQVMNVQGARFTLILTVLLVGVVVGAALAPWISTMLSREKWYGRAVIGFGVIMIIFALIDFYVLSLLVIFPGGMLLGFLLVTSYTLLHENLDEEIRGRVFAAMQTIMRTCLLVSMGVFALVASLFQLWIPWKPTKPVSKALNLGFMSKSFYPATLALMVGGIVVVVGGIISIRTMRHYLGSKKEVGPVETAETAAGP